MYLIVSRTAFVLPCPLLMIREISASLYAKNRERQSRKCDWPLMPTRPRRYLIRIELVALIPSFCGRFGNRRLNRRARNIAGEFGACSRNLISRCNIFPRCIQNSYDLESYFFLGASIFIFRAMEYDSIKDIFDTLFNRSAVFKILHFVFIYILFYI